MPSKQSARLISLPDSCQNTKRTFEIQHSKRNYPLW